MLWLSQTECTALRCPTLLLPWPWPALLDSRACHLPILVLVLVLLYFFSVFHSTWVVGFHMVKLFICVIKKNFYLLNGSSPKYFYSIWSVIVFWNLRPWVQCQSNLYLFSLMNREFCGPDFVSQRKGIQSLKSPKVLWNIIIMLLKVAFI